jgi:hypothetical protein
MSPAHGSSLWDAATLAADPASWQLDVDHADLRGTAAAVARALRAGPGVVCARGFGAPGEAEPATHRYAEVAAALGRLLPQNRDGALLHHVRAEAGRGAERRYGSKGSGELLFHTDQAASPPERRPRILGLLALDRAARGGETRLVSGEAVVARVAAQVPDAEAALRTPVAFARDDGLTDDPPVMAPVLETRADGRPAIRYNRYFTEVGARRTGTAPPAEVTRSLDAFDAALADESLVHVILLEPGDAVFVDNLAVLHDRTAYEDDEVHQRCLVRAWMA